MLCKMLLYCFVYKETLELALQLWHENLTSLPVRTVKIYSWLPVSLVECYFMPGSSDNIWSPWKTGAWEGVQWGRSIRAQNSELRARRIYFTFASHLAVPDACSAASKFAHAARSVRKRWIDARRAAIFYYRPNGAEREKKNAWDLVHGND